MTNLSHFFTFSLWPEKQGSVVTSGVITATAEYFLLFQSFLLTTTIKLLCFKHELESERQILGDFCHLIS